MPTVHREAGFAFSFFSDEPGEPPHVHVIRGNDGVKVWLDPIAIARARGFKTNEITAIMRIVRANAPAFLDSWHGFFGTTHPELAPRR